MSRLAATLSFKYPHISSVNASSRIEHVGSPEAYHMALGRSVHTLAMFISVLFPRRVDLVFSRSSCICSLTVASNL